jgi:hypothetical protein
MTTTRTQLTMHCMARLWKLQTVALAVGACVVMACPARALDVPAGEAKALEDCDRRLCTIVLQRKPYDANLKCALSKTWARSSIKQADAPMLTWGFGDARCSVQLQISQALIVAALTEKRYKLWVPAHTVNCIVEEGGSPKPIRVTLAPKIVFEKGKAKEIWINPVSMEGSSTITDLLWAVAKLEDGTGLFHPVMIKEVNKYIHVQCAKNYPEALIGNLPPPAAQ